MLGNGQNFDYLKYKNRAHISELMDLFLNAGFLPLSIAVNKSMETGVFSSKLKIAKVIPIYKSKDKQSFTNNRPISLLPNVSKIYEKIVHNRLYNYMTINSLMNKN